jgi:hypothetical protein
VADLEAGRIDEGVAAILILAGLTFAGLVVSSGGARSRTAWLPKARR